MKIKFLTESLSINDLFTDKELSKFDDKQLREIREGLEKGLTKEQILLYANPKFTYKQMFEIRLGLKEGLTKEQILLYASPEFDSWQMHEIRAMLLDYKNNSSSITLEDIEDVADASISFQKMIKYRNSFE